jgi:hypothetical protein
MIQYPGCELAVEFHENAALAPVWVQIRSCGASPEQVFQVLKVASGSLGVCPDPRYPIDRIRSEMEHPNFRRYISAKLGAV